MGRSVGRLVVSISPTTGVGEDDIVGARDLGKKSVKPLVQH